jgi:hypothetical protein
MLTSATETRLDDYIWPQVQSLMLNDAYFKLVKYVFEIGQKYIDPIGNLVVNGYITFQMIGIRRLCDNRKDVISLRRLLVDSALPSKQALLKKLDACDEVCDRATDPRPSSPSSSEAEKFPLLGSNANDQTKSRPVARRR